MAQMMISKLSGDRLMYVRFAAAIAFILLIWCVDVRLAKKSAALQSQVNQQYHQMETLRDYHAQLRMRTTRLSLLPTTNINKTTDSKPSTKAKQPAVPLLRINK